MTILHVKITTDSSDKLGELTKYNLDLNPRSSAKRTDGKFEVAAIVSDEQTATLKKDGYGIEIVEDISAGVRDEIEKISDGTRFDGKTFDADFDPMYFDEYWEAREIEKYIKDTAAANSSFMKSELLSVQTYDQNRSQILRIKKGTGTKKAILFLGGLHAREWIPPEAHIWFIHRLKECYNKNLDMVIGGKTFDKSWIKAIVERIEVILFPLVNPDGRIFAMSRREDKARMWRRNRLFIRKGKPGEDDYIGVDINRNFNFLFTSGIDTLDKEVNTYEGNYRGKEFHSEAETKNVVNVLDNNPNIVVLCDIHSWGNDIMCPWGDDSSQCTEKTMAFWNKDWDGKRGIAGDKYKEYMHDDDKKLMLAVGNRMREALLKVKGNNYNVYQSFDGTPQKKFRTSATVDDYTYSRHLNPNIKKGKVYAYTIECSPKFVMPHKDIQQHIDDVNAAMMELCCALIAGQITDASEEKLLEENFDSSTPLQEPALV